MNPLDLISSHPWQHTTFTTYALSLSFFEVVVLDALVRGGSREALILSDVEGVRAALTEQGARRAGRDYEVEPVAVRTGVFHPKITVLVAEAECHVLVGSGNLTFGGWGGNLEVLEHLHPEFAANAINDAASFFESFATTEHVTHGATDHCARVAEALRKASKAGHSRGDIRILHNVEAPLVEQLAQLAEDLGGATRLIAVAPFWDHGAAIDRLCATLGLDHCYVHRHPMGAVRGTIGASWPSAPRTAIQATHLNIIHSDPRHLHAKLFELVCRRGRVLLSGSANATSAALVSRGNIEACVARIERQPTVGWTFENCEPPGLIDPLPESEEDRAIMAGVLRAVLENDVIAGQVLTPMKAGPAKAFHISAEGPRSLGDLHINSSGGFRFPAPDLELLSWRGGRLVLRIQGNDGKFADGFVSVAAFAELVRNAGTLAPRFLAVLAGTETPTDVALVMSWFHEDPRRLISETWNPATNPNRDKIGKQNATIAVADLLHGRSLKKDGDSSDQHVVVPGWTRFMSQLFRALRDPREPFDRTSTGHPGEDDDDELGDERNRAKSDPAIGRALSSFDRLFERLLAVEQAGQYTLRAFDLTQYVSERLDPGTATTTRWLRRLIAAILETPVPTERAPEIAAAVLLLLGSSPHDPLNDRHARLQLLRLGISLEGDAPSAHAVRGFHTALGGQIDTGDLWTRIQSVRSFPEQISSYLAAMRHAAPSDDYPDLQLNRDEWPVLSAAITSEVSRRRILIVSRSVNSCPRCNIGLPKQEIQKLRTNCVALAKNCCRRVIIREGL